MRLFLLLCASLFLTTALSAQYQKGNWYLEGSSSTLLDIPTNDNQRTSSLEAQAFRTGYFFTDRLLIGSRVEMYAAGGSDLFDSSFDVELRPFARYYFPGGDKRKVSYFGEVGFGAITPFSGLGSFETDFHFGGGAEVTLLPGVVGTALLRYDANASGLNITNLTFGLNLLLGQMEKSDREPMLSAGTFTTTGSLGGLYYGRQGLSGSSDIIGGVYLNPSLGYFFANGLMVEGEVSTSFLRLNDIFNSGQGVEEMRKTSVLNSSMAVNVRYYFKQSGPILPYITAGGGYQSYRIEREDSSLGTFGDQTTITSNLFYQAGAGASWFLSPNVALDGTLRYRSVNYDVENLNSSINPVDPIRQNAIQAQFGVRLFLRK